MRSANDKMFAGVCGGLAEYFGIDATIVRLIFVVAVLSGVSPLLYVVLWIVMPDAANVGVASQPRAMTDQTGEWKFDPYTGQEIQR
jgi:phage shock protein C